MVAQGASPFMADRAGGSRRRACWRTSAGTRPAGTSGSRILRSLCMLSLEPDSCVADTEHMFTRFGTRVLLIAKFVPGLGAVATAMSGVVGAPLAGFVAYDASARRSWAITGVIIGAVFHDAVDDVFRELSALGRTGGLFVLGALIAFLALEAVAPAPVLQAIAHGPHFCAGAV